MSFASKGHLPDSGGILDQDSWFIDAWGILEGEENKIEREKRER